MAAVGRTVTGDITVLVVDDHPTFRSGVRAVLDGEAGITVTGEAGDGETALTAARELSPDVVLMDLVMPGMGGVEATRHLVAEGARVVVLTMSTGDEAVFAALRAGAFGYLLKEAPPDDIVAAVRAAATGNAMLGGLVAERLSAFFASPAAAEARPFPQLTEREREILELVAAGRDNAFIARSLVLSQKTVRNYVSAILAKLHAADRAEVIVRAREAGFGTGPG